MREFRRSLPSVERLKALFDYEPAVGVLRWRWRSDMRAQWNARYAGKIVGCENRFGHIVCNLDDRTHLVHRLIWKLVTGDEPPYLDHHDANPTNNSWVNLRAASQSQNLGNGRRHRDNLSGRKGVSRGGSGYKARLKNRHLGVFATPEEAHLAYVTAAEEHFGEFARSA